MDGLLPDLDAGQVLAVLVVDLVVVLQLADVGAVRHQFASGTHLGLGHVAPPAEVVTVHALLGLDAFLRRLHAGVVFGALRAGMAATGRSHPGMVPGFTLKCKENTGRDLEVTRRLELCCKRAVLQAGIASQLATHSSENKVTSQ